MPEQEPKFEHHTDNPLLEVVSQISRLCFSPELLRRYQTLSELQPDYIENTWITSDAQGNSAHVELGVVKMNNHGPGHTFIDNFEHVGHGTIIRAGALIGPYCYIGNRVTIEGGAEIDPGCRIEHGAYVASGVVAEEGATVLAGASIGENSILQRQSEIGYDVSLPGHTVTKPKSFTHRTNDPEEPFASFSK